MKCLPTRSELNELWPLLTPQERARLNRLWWTIPLRSLRLLDFFVRLTPSLLRPEWLSPVADLFERIDSGEAVRAVVNVPPQHGKTLLILHAIAWLLRRHPEWPIGYASYNSTQARSKSRLARDYAIAAGMKPRRDADSLHEWLLP